MDIRWPYQRMLLLDHVWKVFKRKSSPDPVAQLGRPIKKVSSETVVLYTTTAGAEFLPWGLLQWSVYLFHAEQLALAQADVQDKLIQTAIAWRCKEFGSALYSAKLRFPHRTEVISFIIWVTVVLLRCTCILHVSFRPSGWLRSKACMNLPHSSGRWE